MGLILRQETRFPEEGTVRFSLSCEKPVDLAIRIRRPAWATGEMAMRVNGKPAEVDAKPGSYAVIRREWKDGDRIEVVLPMALRAEAMPDNPKRVALLYGPIVLAGDLGSETAETPRVPVFVTEGKGIREWIRPVEGKPLAFATTGAGRSKDVELIPFYRMHHRRYSVYWDLFTEEEWKRREEEYRAEGERRKALDARTVDVLAIGEMQPERDHNVRGEKTDAGDFNGRKWRHAVDGGWFSFEMKAPPDRPVDLVLTYWGSDVGRVFDILVDGETIATQTLENNQPGRFFDVTHPLPESLTKGKTRVTVRLQAHPGKWAGGLFSARLVNR